MSKVTIYSGEYVGDQPAEEKGEVGDVEDRLSAPLVHQLAKCEGVDDGADIGGRDNPRTADFLERDRWTRISWSRKGLLTLEQSHWCCTDRE